MTQIACIGVGTVGSAWAAVFARAGHGVTLFDTDPATVAEIAWPRIEATLDQLHDAMPTGETPRDILARIRSSGSLEEAVREADVVQESVREDIGTKRTVFDEIGRHVSADCLLMSSTSALPGSGFLCHIPSPERALVAHPVNPPSHIPLVELCATGRTAPETVEKARAFLIDAGMEPITVNREIDGFILNRLQYTLVAEAMHLVGEGYCSAEDVDRVMTSGLALRWASIGPFMTAHLNARDGLRGFVEQLGPMMKAIGKDARTNYDWDMAMIESIHAELSRKQPVETIPKAQAWRDRRILAARQMQKQDTPPAKPRHGNSDGA